MNSEIFRGPDLKAVLDAVRRACGEDAMIVRTRGPAEIGFGYEVTVVPAGRATPSERSAAARRDGPVLIALVGPAGFGKTTAAVKLALHYSREVSRVALLTLDDFKVGALEQIQMLSELTGIPLDTIHGSDELPALRARLARYDVVIADTPGRRSAAGDAAWAPLLAALVPDEVHLVLHAGLSVEVLPRALACYGSLTPDHVLLAHVDLLPPGSDPLRCGNLLRLPVSWLCDSPDLRRPLRSPPARSEAPLPAAPGAQFTPSQDTLTLWQAHALAGARLRGAV